MEKVQYYVIMKMGGGSMKNINWSLIIGSITILLLLFVMIYEDALITADPYSLDKGLEYVIKDQVFKLEHPIKPNRTDKLGTDPLGRNVLSLLIKGTKVTVGIAFIATLIRLVLGSLAFEITHNRKKNYRESNRFYCIFISLALEIIIGYFILNRNYFKRLELHQAIWGYGIVLGIIGWTRVFHSLNQGIFYNWNYNYNKTKNEIELPTVIISFFLEMGMVLFTLCIFGFLGITVGINKYANISTKWGSIPNYNPEWGGILAVAKQAIALRKYWLILYPLIFFIINIVGFLLVAHGLLNNINNYGTIVSRRMKKIGRFLSPKQYVKDVKRFKWNRTIVVVKSMIILLIALWIAPSVNAGDEYKIDSVKVWQDLETIYSDLYIDGDITVEGRDKVAEYIANELRNVDRILPVFNEEYIQDIEGQGKNIAGYIWGKYSNNPLVIVTDYTNGLYENGTSTAAILELARSIGEKSSRKMPSRTMVFLFIDGKMEDGRGAYSVLGNKNIGENSFYIYLSYLGLEDNDVLYMDTSTVFSGYRRHYKNIRNVKDRSKELGIPIKQDYFDLMFKDLEIFSENKVSGLAISGVKKDDYNKYHGGSQDDVSKINPKKLEEQIQLMMNIVLKYAWTDKYWLGDSF